MVGLGFSEETRLLRRGLGKRQKEGSGIKHEVSTPCKSSKKKILQEIIFAGRDGKGREEASVVFFKGYC